MAKDDKIRNFEDRLSLIESEMQELYLHLGLRPNNSSGGHSDDAHTDLDVDGEADDKGDSEVNGEPDEIWSP